MRFADELGGYEYDLFISYAHVDDTRRGQGELGWISEFYLALEESLNQIYGRREGLRIYFDNRKLASNHDLRNLERAARSSAMFLAIASRGYFASEYAQKELSAFVSQDSYDDRLFALEISPPDDRWMGRLLGQRKRDLAP